jgi:hypothetical protein
MLHKSNGMRKVTFLRFDEISEKIKQTRHLIHYMVNLQVERSQFTAVRVAQPMLGFYSPLHRSHCALTQPPRMNIRGRFAERVGRGVKKIIYLHLITRSGTCRTT